MGVKVKQVEVTDEKGTIVLTVELPVEIEDGDTIRLVLPGLTMEADPDTWQMFATVKESQHRMKGLRDLLDAEDDNKFRDVYLIGEGKERGGKIRRGWEKEDPQESDQWSEYTWTQNHVSDTYRFRNNKTGNVSNVPSVTVAEYGGPARYAKYLARMEGVRKK